VLDRPRVRRLLERERPDALVHLAFVVDPMHDEQAMYQIDVGGPRDPRTRHGPKMSRDTLST
jgi:hypothetical protein